MRYVKTERRREQGERNSLQRTINVRKDQNKESRITIWVQSTCKEGMKIEKGENFFALIHQACGSLKNAILVISKEKKLTLSNY